MELKQFHQDLLIIGYPGGEALFTGIIEEKGRLVSRAGFRRVGCPSGPPGLEGTRVGDSIAANGFVLL